MLTFVCVHHSNNIQSIYIINHIRLRYRCHGYYYVEIFLLLFVLHLILSLSVQPLIIFDSLIKGELYNRAEQTKTEYGPSSRMLI